MIDYNNATILMHECRVGARPAPGDRLIYPFLTPSAQPLLLPAERILAQEHAKNIQQHGFAVPVGLEIGQMLEVARKREIPVVLGGVVIYVTTHRIVWVVDRSQQSGERITGHLWYPWLQSISYRPKQSFLLESVLQLALNEDDRDGWYSHTIEFSFDKTFNPAGLAGFVGQTAARHLLGQNVPEEHRAKLEWLAQAPPPPPPAKGETADIDLPTRVEYPALPASYPTSRPGKWVGAET